MKRICGNKVMMALVMLILVAGIGAIIWLRFFSSIGTSSNGGAGVNATTREVESVMPPLRRQWRRYV